MSQDAPDRRDPVVERVRQRLHDRSQFGIVKYNTTLAENPAEEREILNHALEEALDLANYLTWRIMKLDGEL